MHYEGVFMLVWSSRGVETVRCTVSTRNYRFQFGWGLSKSNARRKINLSDANMMSLVQTWYQSHLALRLYPLIPLSWLFCSLVSLRRWHYRQGDRVKKLPVPVIIVGNITVGGTGKTPMVLWLARYLQQQGYRPGIISRGYGGQSHAYPLQVYADSDPLLCGDEPILMAQANICPLAIAPKRVEAAQLLLANTDCNILISDDGLQHYALARDIEIVLLDAQRGVGNGWCLPAGPLREAVARLDNVDFCLSKGDADHGFAIIPQPLQSLHSQSSYTPPQSGDSIHAIAGIANPDAFFKQLRKAGFQVIEHAFTDHHNYQADDLNYSDYPLIMTEKDGVKCRRFQSLQSKSVWFMPIQAQPNRVFIQQLTQCLKTH